MGSREIYFEADLRCDLCGIEGAYDVYGDAICPTCMGEVPASSETLDVKCEELVKVLADLTEQTCRLDDERVCHTFVVPIEETFKVLVQAGYLEHESWDVYRWTDKRQAEKSGM